MKTKRIGSFCIPVMITTAAMSAIAFAGCSQDDELDECENTYKTHAEMMMTRAGEDIIPTTSPDTLKASKTFTETFQFPIPTGNNYVGSCGYRIVTFTVKIYRKKDKTYKAEISTKDKDISLICRSLGVNGKTYTVNIDASIDNPGHKTDLKQPERFHTFCYVYLP